MAPTAVATSQADARTAQLTVVRDQAFAASTAAQREMYRANQRAVSHPGSADNGMWWNSPETAEYRQAQIAHEHAVAAANLAATRHQQAEAALTAHITATGATASAATPVALTPAQTEQRRATGASQTMNQVSNGPGSAAVRVVVDRHQNTGGAAGGPALLRLGRT